MKTILFSIFAALAITSTAQANYSTSLCWGGYIADGTHETSVVQPTTGICKCSAATQGCATAGLTSPGGTCGGSGWSAGNTADDRQCCVTGPCDRTPEEMAQEKAEVIATAEAGLDDVFGANGERATYWGYMDSTNKSPTGGRGNSNAAKLDACLGHGTVTGYTIGNSSSWMSCTSTCDTSTNGYCDNSGTNDGSTVTGYVCKDRCDCYLGFGTCAGL